MIDLGIFNILESAIILAIFCLFYKAFLQRETFFKLNRVYLLSSLVFAVIIPFLNINVGLFANHISSGNDIFSIAPIFSSSFFCTIEALSNRTFKSSFNLIV